MWYKQNMAVRTLCDYLGAKVCSDKQLPSIKVYIKWDPNNSTAKSRINSAHVNTASKLSSPRQPGFDQGQIPLQPPDPVSSETVQHACLQPYCSETTSETFSFALCQEAVWFQSWSITTPDVVRFRAHNLQRDLFGALKPCGANGLTAISNQHRNWFLSLHGQQRSRWMSPPGLTVQDITTVSWITFMRRGGRLDVKQWKYFGRNRRLGCHSFPLKFSVIAEDWWRKKCRSIFFATICGYVQDNRINQLHFTRFHKLFSVVFLCAFQKCCLSSNPAQSDSPGRHAITVYDWGRLAPALFTHLLVALEDWRSDKGLLTQVALILLVAVVHHLDVDVERVLPLEGGVALVTLECPLTCGKDRGTFIRAISSLSIVAPLNTQPSRTARGDPISLGWLCGQKNTKRGVSLHQTTLNNGL